MKNEDLMTTVDFILRALIFVEQAIMAIISSPINFAGFNDSSLIWDLCWIPTGLSVAKTKN